MITDSVTTLNAKIALLREAKNLLYKEDYKFVCLAIMEASHRVLHINDTTLFTALSKLLGYIDTALEGCVTLEDWCKNKNIYLRCPIYARIQWVDWMLDSLNADLLTKEKILSRK